MACRLTGAKPLSEPMLEYFVNWTLRNKAQWNINRNSYIFIQENVSENVVGKMAAMLSRPQCVNGLCLLVNGKTSLTPHVVLPLFVTRFSACTGGISFTFMSPLNLYKTVCMKDLACTFIGIRFTNMFPYICNSGSQAFSLNIYCCFNIQSHCFYVCVYQRCPKL